MTKNILIVILIVISIFLITQLLRGNGDNLEQKSENNSQNLTNSEDNTTESKDNNNQITNTANKLSISNQNLDKLPSYVLSRTDIEELDISNNSISGALPGEIRHLQNLKVLNASNNKITGVPAEIGQLTNLEVLDLSNNQLTGLPYEMGNLKSLKTLNLSGNNYAQQDLDIIKKSLPESTEIIL